MFSVDYNEWQQTAREIPDEDQSQFYGAPLKLLTLFRYQTEAFALPTHRSHFSLKFTLAGREEYGFGRRKVSLDAGQALFVNDGADHNSRVQTQCEALSLHLPDHFVSHLVVANGLNNEVEASIPTDLPHVAFDVSAVTQNRLNRFLATSRQWVWLRDAERLSAAAMHLAQSALADLQRLVPPGSLADVVKPAVRDELAARVLRARTYLEDTQGENYDIDTLADVACLSKYHLIRLFADLVGETPGAFARRRRLDAAQAALARGDDWALVAKRAGYGSLRRFRDAYRRQFGQLPQPG